jgi:pimeloyl-ACP methyl ester carboxylesterase
VFLGLIMAAKISDSDFHSAIEVLNYLTEGNGVCPKIEFSQKYQEQAITTTALKALSQAGLEGTKGQKEKLQALRPRIKKLNELLVHDKIEKEFPHLGHLSGFKITLPNTPTERFIAKVTRIIRIALSILFDLILVPLAIILTLIAACNIDFNPSNVKKDKIPILLVHGSGTNDATTWLIGRQYLKKKEFGSVFSMNLDKANSMDDHKGIDYFAKEKIRPEVKRILKLTGQNEIILIGHSMGGMVSGFYAEHLAQEDGVKVNHVISIGSPWQGAYAIDKFLSMGGYFRRSKDTERHHQMSVAGETKRTPNFRRRLVAKALESERAGKRKYYNIWSTVDPAVGRHQGGLTEDPRRQKLFKSVGHYGIVLIPPTWYQVQAWLKDAYKQTEK